MRDFPEDDEAPRGRRHQDNSLYQPLDQRIPTAVWFIAGALALAFLAIMIYRAATTPPDTSTPPVTATPSPAASAPTWQISVAPHV